MLFHKDPKMPHEKLLIASVGIVASLTAYGRMESFYMSSECGIFQAAVYNFLFLLPTAIVLLLLVKRVPRRRGILSAVLYLLFLALYLESLNYVNSKSVLLSLPNPFPQVFTWFGDRIPVFTYHFLLFDLGFLFMILSLTLLLDGKLRRSFFALLGALLIGLTYQDWFWFLTYPKGHLACGFRYGVYFTWWLKFGPFCLPGMYLVNVLAGLGLLFTFGERSKEFVVSILVLISGITLIGLALSCCL